MAETHPKIECLSKGVVMQPVGPLAVLVGWRLADFVPGRLDARTPRPERFHDLEIWTKILHPLNFSPYFSLDRYL